MFGIVKQLPELLLDRSTGYEIVEKNINKKKLLCAVVIARHCPNDRMWKSNQTSLLGSHQKNATLTY